MSLHLPQHESSANLILGECGDGRFAGGQWRRLALGFIYKLICNILNSSFMTFRYRTNDPYTNAAGILANKLGMTDEHQLQEKETELLVAVSDRLFSLIPDTHRFGQNDVSLIHHVWLKPLFSWAGKYRTVDISSEGIRWCHAKYIESEMRKAHALLQDWTPFSPAIPWSSMIEKLARIHGDLILIHFPYFKRSPFPKKILRCHPTSMAFGELRQTHFYL